MKYEKSQGSADGIYIEERVITGVVDLSGTIHPHINKQFDMYIQVQFAQKRNNKTGEMMDVFPLEIFGNFDRDKETGAVNEAKWGSAFKIGNFFDELGLSLEVKSEEGYRIPPALLAASIGKKICVLTYVSGARKTDDGYKAKTWAWDVIAGEGKMGTLKAQFLKQVKDGYMKNYKPNAVAEATEERSLEGQAPKDSEELPF